MTSIEAVDSDTGQEILGSVVPRIFTPPLVTGPPGQCGCGCALTWDTTDGFEFVEFCDRVLRIPPDPHQRFLAIHGMELLPDGRRGSARPATSRRRKAGKTDPRRDTDP